VKLAPDGAARVEFEVRFSPERKQRQKPQARPREASAPSLKPVPLRVPRITRLLVLGYHFERLVRGGAVRDYADLARLTGLSKARVTQIVNLTLLVPDIQAEILVLDERTNAGNTLERGLRDVTSLPDWNDQRRALNVPRP